MHLRKRQVSFAPSSAVGQQIFEFNTHNQKHLQITDKLNNTTQNFPKVENVRSKSTNQWNRKRSIDKAMDILKNIKYTNEKIADDCIHEHEYQGWGPMIEKLFSDPWSSKTKKFIAALQE